MGRNSQGVTKIRNDLAIGLKEIISFVLKPGYFRTLRRPYEDAFEGIQRLQIIVLNNPAPLRNTAQCN